MESFNLYNNSNYIIIIFVIGLILVLLLDLSIRSLAKRLERRVLKDGGNNEEIKMTSKELAEEIRSIITYLCEVSGKQDKYALECCDELDKKLETLEILKNYINTVNNGFTLCGNYYDEKDFKKEDFGKIMGWLKNDK